jgi:uncharacterized repeat protein (TIGR03803 family)
MTKLSRWKTAWAVSVLCAATAIAAPAQTFSNLFNFAGTNGNDPEFETLLQGADGHLYGTTWIGGDLSCNAPSGCGTIFKLSTEGLKTLHNFESNLGGSFTGLILATDGNFYGDTYYGGDLTCNPPYGCGTIFKLTPSGTLTTVHQFELADGTILPMPLVEGIDGNLYGTTQNGGSGGNGTVFKISLTGNFAVLHNFDATGTDGLGPSSLVQATDGAFYGLTGAGGSGSDCLLGCGTIFKITPAGAFTTLHDFSFAEGTRTSGGLIQASDGNLYGTREEGGNTNCPDNNGYGCGTLFRFDIHGGLTTMYMFCSQPYCVDGYLPGVLVQGTDGNLYGATVGGGDDTGCDAGFGCGTVYEMSLGGTQTTLHTFQMKDGENPDGGLFQATDGNFYATTRQGGGYGDGTVFRLGVGLGPFVSFVRAAAKVGETGGILGQGFTGTTNVSVNGTQADFTVVSDTFIKATVPVGATTGYVTVTTSGETLTSNVPFHVIP